MNRYSKYTETKIFTASSAYDLEVTLNEFIYNNKEKNEVIDIKFSTTKDEHVSVLASTLPRPIINYSALIIYNVK